MYWLLYGQFIQMLQGTSLVLQYNSLVGSIKEYIIPSTLCMMATMLAVLLNRYVKIAVTIHHGILQTRWHAPIINHSVLMDFWKYQIKYTINTWSIFEQRMLKYYDRMKRLNTNSVNCKTKLILINFRKAIYLSLECMQEETLSVHTNERGGGV